jgi:hypothetical protein
MTCAAIWDGVVSSLGISQLSHITAILCGFVHFKLQVHKEALHHKQAFPVQLTVSVGVGWWESGELMFLQSDEQLR